MEMEKTGIKSEKEILEIGKALEMVIHRYNLENIIVTDTISSYYLKKIDEELWNKFNKDKKYLLDKVENEEIIINKGRIKFILKGDGNYVPPIKKDIFNGAEYIEEAVKRSKLDD